MTALLFAALAHAAPYAIVVGADTPPPGRATLRYAASDARAVRDVLIDVGGHTEQDVLLLVDPAPEELLAAIAAAPPGRDRFLLYYSGHADDVALYPKGRKLAVGELKAALERVQAGVRIGVVDACRGGGWTGAKGVSPAEPFEISLASEGTAYLAASSGAEDAHELEALGGSIFTHHWTAGLRGAADTNSDGLVTLGESFDWARARTVRDSALLAGQPQHPSFHLDVHGRHELVLADLRGSRSRVTLRWGPGEVQLFALDTGTHVADLDAQPALLVLPPGRYAARRVTEQGPSAAEFQVEAGAPSTVAPEDFEALGSVGLVAHKGDEVAALHRMSPRRGHQFSQTDLGSWVGPHPEGPLTRRMMLRSILQVGITERLSFSYALPGFSLWLGRPRHLEVLLFGGFYDGGLGLSWRGERSVLGLYGDLGAGLDTRRPLSEHVAIVSSTWGGVFTPLEPDQPLWGAPTFGFGLGTEVHVAPRVIVRPAFGGEYVMEGRSWKQGRVMPMLGGSLRRGARELPFLQIDLDDTTALDIDIGLSFDPDRLRTPVQETWIGLTSVLPPKRRKRDR